METNKYHFQLEKGGKAKKHKCPCCKCKSLTLYVDIKGNSIDDSCGRCDHEESCRYHYTPKMFFKDHPDWLKEYMADSSHISLPKVVNPFLPSPAIQTLWPELVDKSLSDQSNFMDFYKSIVKNEDTIKRVMTVYCLGATKAREVIFWQIDKYGQVRSGKFMQYDSKTGHRIKGNDKGCDWVHARLKNMKKLDSSFQLSQCFFGEHLLKFFPDKTIAVVEAEKTAIWGYTMFPQYLWLATGGKSQKVVEKLKVLKGRKVMMFPDIDAQEDWKKYAEQAEGCDVTVSSILVDYATTEDIENKVDIADKIIELLKANEAEPP